MNRKLRTLITLVLVACLMYGGSQLVIQLRSHQQAKASVEAALAAAQTVQVYVVWPCLAQVGCLVILPLSQLWLAVSFLEQIWQ